MRRSAICRSWGRRSTTTIREGQMMGYLEKLEFSKDWTKAEDFSDV